MNQGGSSGPIAVQIPRSQRGGNRQPRSQFNKNRQLASSSNSATQRNSNNNNGTPPPRLNYSGSHSHPVVSRARQAYEDNEELQGVAPLSSESDDDYDYRLSASPSNSSGDEGEAHWPIGSPSEALIASASFEEKKGGLNAGAAPFVPRIPNHSNSASSDNRRNRNAQRDREEDEGEWDDTLTLEELEESRGRGERGNKEKRGRGRPREKEINGNWMLNFNFARRPASPPRRAPVRSAPVTHYRKERFLQANYRFVVKAEQNYIRYLYEQDAVVDWDDIEQIYLTTPEEYNCPICLDRPVAPKMTKCGHIYCWCCILRYLGGVDKGWRKCPICFESVSRLQMKSAVIEVKPAIKENDTVTFSLMERQKSSMIALPKDQWRALANVPLDSDTDASFSRVVRMPNIRAIIDREQAEISELGAIAAASGDVDALPFIQDAQVQLDERRVASGHDAPVPKEEVEAPKTASKENQDTFYFYQLSDGQNIFLHPLAVRVLEREFASNMPQQLEAKVLFMEEGTQSDHTRRRLKKVVGHLPLSTSFLFCDVDLKPLVSGKTLLAFSDELRFRQQKREKQQREKMESGEAKTGRRHTHDTPTIPDRQQPPPDFGITTPDLGFVNDAVSHPQVTTTEPDPDAPPSFLAVLSGTQHNTTNIRPQQQQQRRPKQNQTGTPQPRSQQQQLTGAWGKPVPVSVTDSSPVVEAPVAAVATGGKRGKKSNKNASLFSNSSARRY